LRPGTKHDHPERGEVEDDPRRGAGEGSRDHQREIGVTPPAGRLQRGDKKKESGKCDAAVSCETGRYYVFPRKRKLPCKGVCSGELNREKLQRKGRKEEYGPYSGS